MWIGWCCVGGMTKKEDHCEMNHSQNKNQCDLTLELTTLIQKLQSKSDMLASPFIS